LIRNALLLPVASRGYRIRSIVPSLLSNNSINPIATLYRTLFRCTCPLITNTTHSRMAPLELAAGWEDGMGI
jgi:hypothetical protein